MIIKKLVHAFRVRYGAMLHFQVYSFPSYEGFYLVGVSTNK
jgi:hypothetical protein